MANFNFQSIDELNKVISELIATRDTQMEIGSSSGKVSSPSLSKFDTVLVEEDKEVPEGDDELKSVRVNESVDEDWVPTGLDMVVFVPLEAAPVAEEPMEVEENLTRGDGSGKPSEPLSAMDDMSQGETSSNKGMSSIMEALEQLKEMELINPAKKIPVEESSEGFVEPLDEEVEILSARKKRKFSSTKERSKPIRWSSRKMSPAIKEESESEVKTPAMKKKILATTKTNEKPKEVLDELSVSREFLLENKLEEVFELLQVQGWIDLLSVDEAVDKDLVTEFFNNVSKVEMGPVVCLTFEFRGQKLMVTSRDLAAELGLKHEGFDLYTKKFWPEGISEAEKEEMEQRVCNYSEPNVNELNTNNMLATAKVLHRILVHSLLPRKSKTACAQIQDILVLDQILRRKKINWPKLILHHLEYISEFKEVGYAKLVKKILKLSGVYKPNLEVSVQKPLSANSLHRWGFELSDHGGWVKKDHKTPAEVGEPSKVTEEPNLALIMESLARMEKSLDDQKKEIAELKKMIREIIKGMKAKEPRAQA